MSSFLYLLYTLNNEFACFYNASNIFLATNFKHFDFIEWFALNFSCKSFFWNLVYSWFFSYLFIWFINVIVYFTNFNINVKILFTSINSKKLTTKFFLYWFLSFYLIFFLSLWVCPVSSTSIANLCSWKYKSTLSLIVL